MADNRPPRRAEEIMDDEEGWSGGPVKRLAARPGAESRRGGHYRTPARREGRLKAIITTRSGIILINPGWLEQPKTMVDIYREKNVLREKCTGKNYCN